MLMTRLIYFEKKIWSKSTQNGYKWQQCKRATKCLHEIIAISIYVSFFGHKVQENGMIAFLLCHCVRHPQKAILGHLDDENSVRAE